jgi:GDP-L-fucose synthase
MHKAKITDAAEISVWGTSPVTREFFHSDDVADACVFLMNLPEDDYGLIARSDSQPPFFNVGCGEDLTIRELAELIRDVVEFKGQLTSGPSKPDGTLRKLLDVSRRTRLGWSPSIRLRDELSAVHEENSAFPQKESKWPGYCAWSGK